MQSCKVVHATCKVAHRTRRHLPRAHIAHVQCRLMQQAPHATRRPLHICCTSRTLRIICSCPQPGVCSGTSTLLAWHVERSAPWMLDPVRARRLRKEYTSTRRACPCQQFVCTAGWVCWQAVTEDAVNSSVDIVSVQHCSGHNSTTAQQYNSARQSTM